MTAIMELMEEIYMMRDQFIEVAPLPLEASILQHLSPERIAFNRKLARLQAARFLEDLARRRKAT